ncbi:unnamed protein product [Ambrosiozyma monospora]|uniref:Unnamed protein product n=1 Tax=Ambrosiozyma monospora TaxID=43982 RepID=A0ACB5UB74_AMBMO|nr:unnamed protein product [Ambrosiozyma monospora]
MELLELAGSSSSYMSIRELVDQYFPPIDVNKIDTLDTSNQFSDLNYWREPILDLSDLSDDDDEDDVQNAGSKVSTNQGNGGVNSTAGSRAIQKGTPPATTNKRQSIVSFFSRSPTVVPEVPTPPSPEQYIHDGSDDDYPARSGHTYYDENENETRKT